MNFPILSAIIFIPLIGALFILVTKGTQKNVEKNSKYVAIFSSLANFLLSFSSNFENFKFFKLSKHSSNCLTVLDPIRAEVIVL
jgi:NADH:ubiquinone oxidoreductase subunit 4 (subunit M)